MNRNPGEFVIIGGGAAGLMAAIAAGRAGVPVRILEKTRECGRKILVSGNGHCNFSHQDLDPRHYITSCPEYLPPLLKDYGRDWLLDLFADLGIPARADRFGRLLPLCNEAGAVRRALLAELSRLGVPIETACPVRAIRPLPSGFRLETEQGERRGERVLLAAGSAAWPKLGTTGEGAELALRLGHSRAPGRPALVPLELKANPFFRLQGLRMDCRLRLAAGPFVYQRVGELQFAGYGLTGPVALDASLPIARWNRPDQTWLSLNLLPDLPEDFRPWLRERLDSRAGSGRLDDFFVGLLPLRFIERLLPELAATCGLAIHQAVRRQALTVLQQLLASLREFSVELKGTRGFDEARTECGGIHPAELDPASGESRLVAGLYPAGELLDVTGYSGGYNLHFAFASGYRAGAAAAAALRQP